MQNVIPFLNSLRRLAWLRGLYRCLPLRFRETVARWISAHTFKRARFQSLPRLPAAAIESVEPAPGAWPLGAGVNVFGYFRGQFGLAESARQYAKALMGVGYPVALNDIPLEIPHGLNDRSLEAYFCKDAPFDINLVFVNPDYLDRAREWIHRPKGRRPYTIACWFWELETVPAEWLWALDQVDEILVASSFIEQALRRVTDKPILLAPLPVSRPAPGSFPRSAYGLSPDAFVFLNTFDFNSYIHRKNPMAVAQAFRRAFPSGDEKVQLLIKSSNGFRYPEQYYEMVKAMAGDDRVVLRDDILDSAHLRALQQCVDAYVSLHRAEGFGLGMAECMAAGKPVVATGWSGNMQFMTPQNSCLVAYELVPVPEGHYPHAAGAKWAEADIDDAAAYMRRLVEQPLFAAEIGQKARRDVERALGAGQVARTIIDRIDALSTRPASDCPPIGALPADHPDDSND